MLEVSYLRVFVLWILWGIVQSSGPGSGSGLEDCVVTVKLNQTIARIVFISDGPVCFECVFGGVVDTNAVFQVDNTIIDEFNGTMILDGILVVRDVQDVFSGSKVVRCNNGSDVWNQIFIRYIDLMSPLITGNTSVSEGDTLSLDCDSSDSASTPPVHWVSSADGEIISEVRSLVIVNITRDMAGIYTCVTTSGGNTANTSVNVIVESLMPPLVTGNTTVNEGDTLSLHCNSSNSGSLPPVHWVSSNGKIIDNDTRLEVVNITRDMAGIYTCVATSIIDDNTENTSVNIIVKIKCDALRVTGFNININSTEIGSNATYQCKNDFTVIYNISCTSDGMWSRYPNFTRDCPDTEEDSPPLLLIALATVIAVFSLLLCITAVITAGIACKRNSKHKGKFQVTGEENVIEKATTSRSKSFAAAADKQEQAIELEEMTVINGQYNLVTAREITELNGQYSLIQAVPNQIKTESQKTTVAQIESKKTTVVQNESQASSEAQTKLTDCNGQHSTSLRPDEGVSSLTHESSKHPPPHSKTNKNTLTYVEVSPNLSAVSTLPPLTGDRIQYASLVHNVTIKPPAAKHDPDSKVGLDQILIQLKDIEPHWRILAKAVGIEKIQEIEEFVRGDSEAMVEVVDAWLSKLYPEKPTWNIIADTVERIGYSSLAEAIRDVYKTGKLPREVTNAVPETLKVKDDPPPPIPPRTPNKERDSSPEVPPLLPAKPRIYTT